MEKKIQLNENTTTGKYKNKVNVKSNLKLNWSQIQAACTSLIGITINDFIEPILQTGEACVLHYHSLNLTSRISSVVSEH